MNYSKLKLLVARNIKLYFKDKVTFYMSLITPLILLVLFVTFLKDVYIQTLTQSLPEGITLSNNLLNGFAGGWLMSSIMGVICITIAFCSNIVMVYDKINGNIKDIYITPTSKQLINLSYFIANFISTFIVCTITALVGFIYLGIVGFYLSFGDCLMIILVTFITCLLGCLLASVIERFINSQGGVSAVATLISSIYGFICGAYMPISQFKEPIRNIVSFNPGTYSVILFRNFYLNGTLNEMSNDLPPESITAIKNAFDGNFYFFGTQVTTTAQYLVVLSTIALSAVVFILLSKFHKPKQKPKKTKNNK